MFYRPVSSKSACHCLIMFNEITEFRLNVVNSGWLQINSLVYFSVWKKVFLFFSFFFLSFFFLYLFSFFFLCFFLVFLFFFLFSFIFLFSFFFSFFSVFYLSFFFVFLVFFLSSFFFHVILFLFSFFFFIYLFCFFFPFSFFFFFFFFAIIRGCCHLLTLTVIIIRNGVGNPSSIPSSGSLSFISLKKSKNPLSLIMNK